MSLIDNSLDLVQVYLKDILTKYPEFSSCNDAIKSLTDRTTIPNNLINLVSELNNEMSAIETVLRHTTSNNLSNTPQPHYLTLTLSSNTLLNTSIRTFINILNTNEQIVLNGGVLSDTQYTATSNALSAIFSEAIQLKQGINEMTHYAQVHSGNVSNTAFGSLMMVRDLLGSYIPLLENLSNFDFFDYYLSSHTLNNLAGCYEEISSI